MSFRGGVERTVPYRLLADGVLLLHFVFVAFVVLGGFLCLWRVWVAWLHLPAAAWSVAVNAQGWICPLTPLEWRLRMAAGRGAYEGGFLEHYLAPLVYPPSLPPSAGLVLGLGLFAWTAGVYALVIWRRGGKGSRP
ncbi:MAG: DUF2784 domain-containing protein [Ectothiorhodospiraceae bacterium]|jgi:hypothetical protein